MGILEFTKYISPDGISYSFDVDHRFLMTEEGLGMPPIEYITQRGAYQHGETLVDYRLSQRVIQMQMRQDSCSREEYWEKRALLLNMLRPNRFVTSFEPGVLRKEFSDGSIRDIKVVIDRGPVFVARNLSKWDEWGFTETLRFIAHDPVYFDPTLKTVLVDPIMTAPPAPADAQWKLPFEFPIWFGETAFFLDLTTHPELEVTYPGTWLSYPEITIVGPANGFKITNVSTGEFIKFDYSISAGETVVIVLEPGNKSITNNLGVNLAGAISTDSDLTTFHIAPDPEVTGGINNFSIQVAGTTIASEFKMEYYERYIGL